MKIDFKKGAEHVGNAVEKTVALGKKAADSTVAGARSLAAKAQEENVKAQIKKYKPVFPEQYGALDFGLPNLVQIVDTSTRKNIDVCKGAIGWKSEDKGVEIFHLYDGAIDFSGLHFVPAALCGSVYYVDPHDRSRFIRLDCFFDKMQECRLAELQHIAFSLGAKRYSVEMIDVSKSKQEVFQKASMGIKSKIGKGNINGSEEHSVKETRETQRKSLAFAEFAVNRKPEQPTLCWFAHDDNIKNLIHMRCSGETASGIKAYTIELNGADYAMIEPNTAAKIDAAIGKIGGKSDFSMQSKVVEERHHKMSFQIEF